MTWESLDLLLRSLFHAPSYNIQNNIDFYISTLTKANLVSQKIVVLAMPSRDAHCMAKPPFVIAKDPLAWSMLSRIFGCLTHLPLRKRVYVGERVFHMPLSSMCHVTTLCLVITSIPQICDLLTRPKFLQWRITVMNRAPFCQGAGGGLC